MESSKALTLSTTLLNSRRIFPSPARMMRSIIEAMFLPSDIQNLVGPFEHPYRRGSAMQAVTAAETSIPAVRRALAASRRVAPVVTKSSTSTALPLINLRDTRAPSKFSARCFASKFDWSLTLRIWVKRSSVGKPSLSPIFFERIDMN